MAILCDSVDSGISGVLVGECTIGVGGAGIERSPPLVGGAVVGDSTVHLFSQSCLQIPSPHEEMGLVQFEHYLSIIILCTCLCYCVS